MDRISALEKQTRNASDMSSTASLLTLLVRLCWEQRDLDTLNTQLTLMSKKHGQLKEAVVRMVDEAMPYLETLDEEGEKSKDKGGRWLELLTTLRDITEGKIYLELQRARLTAQLAAYHETLSQSAPKEDAKQREDRETNEAKGDEKVEKEPVTAEDHLNAAADLMSEIQIETYSSMDKQEKTNL